MRRPVRPAARGGRGGARAARREMGVAEVLQRVAQVLDHERVVARAVLERPRVALQVVVLLAQLVQVRHGARLALGVGPQGVREELVPLVPVADVVHEAVELGLRLVARLDRRGELRLERVGALALRVALRLDTAQLHADLLRLRFHDVRHVAVRRRELPLELPRVVPVALPVADRGVEFGLDGVEQVFILAEVLHEHAERFVEHH
mmetsp:Transcript_46381/g.143139  ORF Transcript_46381/g.143139 Transcript_46381/m.143139 type:complete len:206 (+) Transcript_46381:1822-2439(+)